MSAPEHPIEKLRRADRHTLGAGDGILFAPPHPQWLHRPGLWDGVQWYTHVLRPAYTLAVLDDAHREITLRESFRSWTPAMLVSSFTGGAIQLTERRVILPGGRIASDCDLLNGSGRTETLWVSAWTAHEGAAIPDRSTCHEVDGALAFQCIARDAQHRDDALLMNAILALDCGADFNLLLEAQRSRGSSNLPEWSNAPFRDRMRSEPGIVRAVGPDAGADGRTLLYFALARRIVLEPGQTFSFTASLLIDGLLDPPAQPCDHAADKGPVAPAVSVAAVTGAVTPASAVSMPPLPGAAAVASRGEVTHRFAAAEASNLHWRDFYQNAPELISSDPFLPRFFAHRWYGLRLNALSPRGLYRYPTCAEGTEFFHEAISYSAWTLARELRWLDPERARGVFRTFFDHQKEDGAYPGIIYVNSTHPTANYFADWGGSLDALEEVQPDPRFLEIAFRSLSRHAAWLGRDRDPDATGLYRVRDPYETGQEYMSRYTSVMPDADRQHFDYSLDLFGIDITVYAYRLHRALARAAVRLGYRESRRAHERTADRIGDAVLARMWDARTRFFSDVDPRTGNLTGIKAAVCFYPWMTDLPGKGHVQGLTDHLFDPRSFWTDVPVPATAADDPSFDPDGYWKGVRRNCPWNGRVWPMTNCHVIEALASTAVTHAPQLRQAAADLLMRTIRMMFFDGDPARPNSFEHYSPVTGEPCAWRGLDDYQHSWLNDQIIRWLVGFRPSHDGFVVDPLPAGIDHARVERLPYRGRLVDVGFDERSVFVEWSGHRLENARDEPLVVDVRRFAEHV